MLFPNSTVVKHSTRKYKNDGLNPATGIGRVEKAKKTKERPSLLFKHSTPYQEKKEAFWSHNAQHKDTHHNDIQHKYTQHKDTQHNEI